MKIIDCILRLHPDWQGTVRDNSYYGIHLHESETRLPSMAELEAVWPAVQKDEALARIRLKRDVALKESDWTQLADAPLSVEKQDAWRIYRHALRDLPSTTEDPQDPIWPVEPE